MGVSRLTVPAWHAFGCGHGLFAGPAPGHGGGKRGQEDAVTALFGWLGAGTRAVYFHGEKLPRPPGRPQTVAASPCAHQQFDAEAPVILAVSKISGTEVLQARGQADLPLSQELLVRSAHGLIRRRRPRLLRQKGLALAASESLQALGLSTCSRRRFGSLATEHWIRRSR
jgi:hypothetical protein